MPNESLKKLYVDELKDLYSAENQLVKALPKMAKAASSEYLRKGFEKHLEQTKGHVARLEEIFRNLEESPKGKKCMGMEGLIKEGSEVIGEDFEGAVMDAALIGAAQRVEHYEIAAYGTVREFARILDEQKHASLLEETLNEEKETDEKLTDLSREINTQAIEKAPEAVQAKSTQVRKMPKRVAYKRSVTLLSPGFCDPGWPGEARTSSSASALVSIRRLLMKPLFGVGLVVLILGVLSFFIPLPHSEHHGISAGDVHLGVTTEHSDRVPYALSIVVVVVGAGLMIAAQTKR